MRQIRFRISKDRILVFLLVLGLVLIPIFLQAKELREQEVRLAVQNWVRYVTADARPDAIIERMEPYIVNGETVAYIAHLFGGGFCLCGANELVLPVYFYSPHGRYDPQNPENKYILEEIGIRLKYLREGLKQSDLRVLQYQQVLSERASFWQALVAGNVLRKAERSQGVLAEPDSMSLRLTCQWGQGSPYNDQCPELTPGADEHTLVGCVATAISQIMYYWKWPTTGVGSYSVDYVLRWRTNWDEQSLSSDPSIPSGWNNRLQWTSAGGGRLRMSGYWDRYLYGSAKRISSNSAYLTAFETLWNRLDSTTRNCSANFGATTYQWNLMQDTHTDPADAGDAAVATLCYHAAVAFDMDFGLGLSSSDLWRTVDPTNNRKPLVNNFRYDTSASYGHDNIANKLTEDVQWLRPVGFSGSGSIGGHAWVVYGYNKGTDPYRQFKLNMGWNGSSDGWYSLDNVPAGLTENHGYLVRIAPQNVVRFVGNTISGEGSPGTPYKDIEEAVTKASNGATLIFKAGSDNTFSAPLTITKPLTLLGRDAVIRKK